MSYNIWSFNRCPNPIWGLIIIDILFYFFLLVGYIIIDTQPKFHKHPPSHNITQTPHGPYTSNSAPHTHLIISPNTPSLFYYSLHLLSQSPLSPSYSLQLSKGSNTQKSQTLKIHQNKTKNINKSKIQHDHLWYHTSFITSTSQS